MSVNDWPSGATAEQRKWIIARLSATTDAAAARAVGVHPSTVCRWKNKAALDEAVDQLLQAPKEQALILITEAVPDAARIKIGALRSRRDQTRQAGATEILDRVLGKAKQSSEISGPGGGPIETKDVSGFTDKERIARIAALLGAQQDE